MDRSWPTRSVASAGAFASALARARGNLEDSLSL